MLCLRARKPGTSTDTNSNYAIRATAPLAASKLQAGMAPGAITDKKRTSSLAGTDTETKAAVLAVPICSAARDLVGSIGLKDRMDVAKI